MRTTTYEYGVQYNNFIKYANWTQQLLTLCLLAYSWKNIKSVIPVLILLQIRITIFYFQTDDILQKSEHPEVDATFVVYLTLISAMNWSLFINLFDNHKVKIYILNTLIINLGLIN
jgi:hypothetical protein